jgi:hypothetical protein
LDNRSTAEQFIAALERLDVAPLLKFDFRDGLICRITEYSNPVAFAKFFGQPLG